MSNPVNAQQYSFGVGRLIGTRQDIPNAPPREFGTLQEVSVDFSADLKSLYGANQYPVAVAAGKTKIEIKAKAALISANIFNDIYFGGNISSGEKLFANGETATIPATTPFTVTVANAATFTDDFGIVNTATGAFLLKVTTLTGAGQYTVNTATGVYTFYSADAGNTLAISYAYMQTGANKGVLLSSGNPLMGVLPFFSMFLSVPYDSRQLNMQFPRCASGKIGLSWKQDDFQVPDMDIMAWADVTGNAFYMSTNT